MSAPVLWLTGDWSRLGKLRAGLESRSDVSVAAGGPTGDDGVIVHASVGSELPQEELAALREHSAAPVLVLATRLADDLVRAVTSGEVADVLIRPQPVDAIVFAALKAAAAASRPGDAAGEAPRVITVFSPKGGTGKSVTACNLAVALASAGRRTLLLDLDLQFGDTAIMLGLEPERTLHHLIAAPGGIDGDKLAAYATRHPSGLHVVPAPVRPEDAELVADERVVELLDAARGAYEAVVVDSSPFFHESLLSAIDRTDRLVLLCVPDVAALKNVRLTLQTLELLSFPPERVLVVLNRANARLGFTAGQVSSVLERPIDFELPDDEAVPIGVNRGVPVVLDRQRSPYAVAVQALAARLVSGEAPRRRRRFRLRLGGRA